MSLKYGYGDIADAEYNTDEYRHGRARPLVIDVSFFVRVMMIMAMGVLASTGIAQLFGVNHVIAKVIVDVDKAREVQQAWLQTPTCQNYIGKLSEDDREKYDKAHLLDTDVCRRAEAYLYEGVYTQRATMFFNHYAMCDAGKCAEFTRELISSASTTAVYLLVALTCILLIYKLFIAAPAHANVQYIQMPHDRLPMNFNKKHD
jgi:hypothetical protein